MRISDLVAAMEKIAPTRLAESWDNVGLIVGDSNHSLSKILFAIDYTPAVAAEAKQLDCDAILAYHPPIFDGLKQITATNSANLIHDAIARGISIYSPHTALDVAEGGTNDVLADLLGLVDRKPLKQGPPKASQLKLVVFVPIDSFEKVSSAIYAAGAGQLGNYSNCGYRVTGTGTFQGNDESNPAIGEKGKLESVEEYRFETLVPVSKLTAVLAALREAHPYEEPAYDLLMLQAEPNDTGIGRIGKLPSPQSVDHISEILKRELGVNALLIAGETNRQVKTVAMCAGACGKLLDDAIAAKVDLYITGEMRHHDAIKAARAGLTVICTLHSNSERITLKRLRDRLAADLPGVELLLSQQDRDPFVVR